VEFVKQALKGQSAAQVLTDVFHLQSTVDVETARMSIEYDRLATTVPRTPEEEAALRRLAEMLKRRLPSPGKTAEAIKAREMIKRMYAQQLEEMPLEERNRLLQEVMLQFLEIDRGSRGSAP
jgi:hypothetical protein